MFFAKSQGYLSLNDIQKYLIYFHLVSSNFYSLINLVFSYSTHSHLISTNFYKFSHLHELGMASNNLATHWSNLIFPSRLMFEFYCTQIFPTCEFDLSTKQVLKF